MTSNTDRLRPRLKLILLLVITLLAAFFRFYRLGSLPPGDGYDPAYYGVDALQLLRGKPLPLMLPPNREVLFSYLVAACFLIVGPSTFGIHLASALVGLATVPAVYAAGEGLFAGLTDEESALRRWGGLVAATMVALSYWHLNWSRYGVRAILVPLVAALTFAFLWRGLLREDRKAFIFCGIALGLGMYTYQAARLLPLLVVVGFAAVAWRRGSISRRAGINLLIVAVVALIVFAPLGVHFMKRPRSFTMRIEQALVTREKQDTVGKLQAILHQTVEALLSFGFVGDRTPYSTISGRPSLNPFLFALFFLGIAVSVARVRRPPYAFLLASFVVMVVPAALAGQGPAAKRAIGTLPAVALLVTVGAFTPGAWLRRQMDGEYPRWLGMVWRLVLVGGFVYSGAVTYRDYFVRWASNPNLYTHFELGLSHIGEYAGALPEDERIYLSPELPSHPAIRFHSGLREDIRGYNGRECLVMPERTAVDTTYIVVPGKDGRSLDRLADHFPTGHVVHEGSWQWGVPYFRAYRIPMGAEAHVSPSRELDAIWNEQIRLLGYDLDRATYQAGDTVNLTCYYQDLEPLERRYTGFVHLLGPQNPATETPLWAQDDSEPCQGFYPTTSWHQGEMIVDQFTLSIPPDAPAGEYELVTGFYYVWTGERLPVMEGTGPAEHNVVPLGEVQVVDEE
jgi:4-amino-4-deoxy-L-arabinose transferase-like glycosyltransferase